MKSKSIFFQIFASKFSKVSLMVTSLIKCCGASYKFLQLESSKWDQSEYLLLLV
jgi:hypothetical protein